MYRRPLRPSPSQGGQTGSGQLWTEKKRGKARKSLDERLESRRIAIVSFSFVSSRFGWLLASSLKVVLPSVAAGSVQVPVINVYGLRRTYRAGAESKTRAAGAYGLQEVGFHVRYVRVIVCVQKEH